VAIKGGFRRHLWHSSSAVSFAANVCVPEHVSSQPAGGDDRQAQQRFDANGNLTDETSRKLIRQLLKNLVAWTRQLRTGK
jgi:hypothetical protein